MCAMPSGRDVHDHQVAAGRPALAVRTAPPAPSVSLVERLEQRGAVDVDVAQLCARVDVAHRSGRGCDPRGRRLRSRRRPCRGPGRPAGGGASSAPRRGASPRRAGRGRGRRVADRAASGRRRRSRRAAGRDAGVLARLLGDVVVGQAAVGLCRGPVLARRRSSRSVAVVGRSSPTRAGAPARGPVRVRRPPSPAPGFLRPRPPRDPRRRRFFGRAVGPLVAVADPSSSAPRRVRAAVRLRFSLGRRRTLRSAALRSAPGGRGAAWVTR